MGLRVPCLWGLRGDRMLRSGLCRRVRIRNGCDRRYGGGCRFGRCRRRGCRAGLGRG